MDMDAITAHDILSWIENDEWLLTHHSEMSADDIKGYVFLRVNGAISEPPASHRWDPVSGTIRKS